MTENDDSDEDDFLTDTEKARSKIGASEDEILTPEELDISQSDHVARLADNRYVVSTEPVFPETEIHPAAESSGSSEENPTKDGSTETYADPDSDPPPNIQGYKSVTDDISHDTTSVNAARRQLMQDLEQSHHRYGFEIVAMFDEKISTQRTTTNDIVETFERLLGWYARQVTDEVPPDEALGVLLLEASIPITYPTQTIGGLLDEYDLGPDDSIRDLLQEIEAARQRK